MSEWVDIVYYSLGGALLVIMAIGIMFSACMPALDRWSKRYFIALFSELLLYVVVIFIDMIIYTYPDLVTEEKTIIIFEHLLFSALSPMPMFFLLHSCGESIKSSILFRTVMTLWGVYCLMLIVAQFTDMFYYATPDNQYYRGSLYALLLVPLILIMILDIVGVIRRRKKLSKKGFTALLIYLLPMTIAMIIYMFATIDVLVSFVISLCALTMLGFILTDNIDRYMCQQREIAHQRAGVMVLQMRPHFICNTMMSIYYLCDQNPKKAKQVTLDFTTYLRKNFTAIASENTVPFKDELEHTRAYLAVEQAQFEDRLFVSFDIPHTVFRVPSLVLQPIVENAVKYGMDPNGKPLNISVKTRRTAIGSEIIVEDNGPGYNPVNDNESHIALNNIRQRLEMMCKGKLEITALEDGGTTVKVTIPAKNDHEEINGSFAGN